MALATLLWTFEPQNRENPPFIVEFSHWNHHLVRGPTIFSYVLSPYCFHLCPWLGDSPPVFPSKTSKWPNTSTPQRGEPVVSPRNRRHGRYRSWAPTMAIWRFPYGNSPSHHRGFNTKFRSSDLDDLGYPHLWKVYHVSNDETYK